MRAPLALGILTWDDVLAGFSVPNFWAEKNLPRGGGRETNTAGVESCEMHPRADIELDYGGDRDKRSAW